MNQHMPPQLSEYNLGNTDIQKLKNEHDIFLKDSGKIQTWKNIIYGFFAIFVFCCTIAPILLIIVIILFFAGKLDINEDAYMIVYGIGGTAVLFLSNLVKSPQDTKNFPHQTEWNNLQRYYSDLKKYEEWQQSCKRSFWENLSGTQFEAEVAKVYRARGYNAKLTSATNDGGVDIILTNGPERIAVQCKAHQKKISPSFARDLYGVISAGNYTSGILATVNGASDNTIDFCRSLKGKKITIIDADDLIKMQEGKI